jgi:putative transposase
MKRIAYPTDLTDAQWQKLERHIPPAKPGGRPRSYEVREILNALFYLARAGCAWRLLPHDFPAWYAVYRYFRQWQQEGTWERIEAVLHMDVRVQAGKEPEPSAAILDSQSVKTTEKGGSKARSVMMRTRRSTDGSGICSSTRSGYC